MNPPIRAHWKRLVVLGIILLAIALFAGGHLLNKLN